MCVGSVITGAGVANVAEVTAKYRVFESPDGEEPRFHP